MDRAGHHRKNELNRKPLYAAFSHMKGVRVLEIRSMTESDRSAVLALMRAFYASDAVYTSGSDEIFNFDIDTCLAGSPYLEGYVFCAGEILGYAMVAKSFSTEFGAPCIWIEDLYLKESARNRGFGSEFIDFITKKYHGCIFRLEVEEENKRAVHVYKKHGFTVLPYTEMKR